MNRVEDDERYDNGNDVPPRRSKRTKFRDFDDGENAPASRDKRSSKRSHRRKSGKDDVWPDTDD